MSVKTENISIEDLINRVKGYDDNPDEFKPQYAACHR